MSCAEWSDGWGHKVLQGHKTVVPKPGVGHGVTFPRRRHLSGNLDCISPAVSFFTPLMALAIHLDFRNNKAQFTNRKATCNMDNEN